MHIDRVLGRYKSQEFISLLKKWTYSLRNKRFLKTDLNEEAYGEDQILFSLYQDVCIFGLDILFNVVKKANLRQNEKNFNHSYITADVRELPFSNNVFDFILSTSTLDHFNKKNDLIKSLKELKRVLNPKGIMIIALNNKHNFNFYLFLKLGRLFRLISYPVQFYSIDRIRRIFNDVGLSILEQDYVVHIISPINTILLLLRKFINNDIVDKLSNKCVSFFHWLSNIKRFKSRTAWFIVLKCQKIIPD